MLKILFMGTPKFSVEVLKGLKEHYEIVGVVTQPDAYVGRKRILTPTPVKAYALENNIPVFTPEHIKDEYDNLIALNADLIVTAAYGQFVGEKLLFAPKYKAINCHGSLLPKYRGGSPIQTAIKNGEKETGITIMYMIKQMDAGDMLAVGKMPIEDSDNQETVFEKLSYIARDLVLETIPKLVNGEITPIKQNEKEVTFAYNITREEELLNFNQPARNVFNHIRAYYPDPATYFIYNDLEIKVYESKLVDYVNNFEPGTIFAFNKSHLGVACENHETLELLSLKPFGKGLMRGCDFINGYLKK